MEGDTDALYDIALRSFDEYFDPSVFNYFRTQWRTGQLVACDVTGKPATLFWILVGVGALMFFGGGMLAGLVMLFSFLLGILILPLSWVGLILGVVPIFLFMNNKKLQEVGKSISDSFVKAVED